MRRRTNSDIIRVYKYFSIQEMTNLTGQLIYVQNKVQDVYC